jgi:hypothetical protein
VSQPRPSLPRRLGIGALVSLLGLVFWALHSVQAGSARHSFAGLANPPQYVRLIAGHRYWISIHGGVQREAELGVSPGALECTAAGQGQAPVALTITAERADTKAINQIASFTPTFSGYVQVQCGGIGLVYVDDAADASFDWSGAWLVLACVCLLIGLPAVLSGLRAVRGEPATANHRA